MKTLKVMAAAAVCLLIAGEAQAGFINIPKPAIELPLAGKISFGRAVVEPFGEFMLCKRSPSVCRARAPRGVVTTSGTVRLTPEMLQKINGVNLQVNAAIIPQAETQGDVWKVGGRYGDCEDYALAKRARLLQMGFPSSSVLMATAYQRSGAYHAILVVRTDRGDFVLDNLSKAIKPWDRTGYRFEMIQSPESPRIWRKV
ncbi:transglutaminase-like cysteine peptidase [Oryzibacter oryziterrae]|uniref:transglutaminase-like cysteine peptidase n=1 Tax=Oryzibacter oryziterrae TaxID=2766474 RepID=UPI001F31C26E|nr:transglutaminase-like cysteine peptidase [Oryzibacter oryziterrae]